MFTKEGEPARPGKRAYRKTPSGKMVLQSQTINQQVEMVQGSSNRAQGKLNPNWVEQLMGIPVGWTDCASWAMESSPPPHNAPLQPSTTN